MELHSNNIRLGITDFFKNARTSSTIISLQGYTNRYGEESNQQILINIDYERVLRDSIETLKKINSVVISEGIVSNGDEDFDNAKAEMLASFEKSLSPEGNPKSDWRDEAFESVTKSVKIHRNDNTIHLSGVSLNKKVVKEGAYSEVKSKRKTIIKNAIKESLPVGKWRQFKLDKDNFQMLAIEGEKINETDLYK